MKAIPVFEIGTKLTHKAEPGRFVWEVINIKESTYTLNFYGNGEFPNRLGFELFIGDVHEFARKLTKLEKALK